MPFLDKPNTHRTPAYLECVFICGAFSFSFCLPLYCNFRRSLLNGAPRFLLLFCFSFSLSPPNVFTQRTFLSSLAKAARLANKAIGFASFRGRVKRCLRSCLRPAPRCRVESRKSRRCSLAPRQQHRQHFSLFNLDVPLKFPLQT